MCTQTINEDETKPEWKTAEGSGSSKANKKAGKSIMQINEEPTPEPRFDPGIALRELIKNNTWNRSGSRGGMAFTQMGDEQGKDGNLQELAFLKAPIWQHTKWQEAHHRQTCTAQCQHQNP